MINQQYILGTRPNQSLDSQKQMKQNSGIVNILMNEKEDLLWATKVWKISFLTKTSENWICQDVIENDRNMIEMSLDNKGNKLIALGDGLFGTKPKVICIFEKQKENKWVKSQQLIVNQNGCGLQFINNNAFVLQSIDEGFLEIFQFNQDLKTFKKAQQQEVQRCANLINFPYQFIQDLNFLTIKHGNYFKLIRKVIYKSFKLFNFMVIGYLEGQAIMVNIQSFGMKHKKKFKSEN